MPRGVLMVQDPSEDICPGSANSEAYELYSSVPLSVPGSANSEA